MTETEKKAVGRYLDWHTGILLETDGKWESTGKRVGNLFIKKRLIPKTGILVCIFFLWENIRYIQAKQDGYAWNVRNCMDYMKEK